MSRTPVRFHAAAARELRQELERYDEQLSGLGDALIAEVEEVLHRISTFPELGAPYVDRTRRIVLRTFPFTLIYTAGAHELVVVAVAHQRRRPLYWLRRVEVSAPGPNTGSRGQAAGHPLILLVRSGWLPLNLSVRRSFPAGLLCVTRH